MSQKCSLPSGRFIPRWSVVIVMIMGVEVGMGVGVTLPGLGPCDMAGKGIVTLLWQAASGILSTAGLSGASARVLVGPLLSRSCTGIANNLVKLQESDLKAPVFQAGDKKSFLVWGWGSRER